MKQLTHFFEKNLWIVLLLAVISCQEKSAKRSVAIVVDPTTYSKSGQRWMLMYPPLLMKAAKVF